MNRYTKKIDKGNTTKNDINTKKIYNRKKEEIYKDQIAIYIKIRQLYIFYFMGKNKFIPACDSYKHYSPGITMQLLEELEEFISSLRAKHPAVAISFSAKVEGKSEAQEPCAQTTSSRKTPPAKHARSAKPPAKKRSPLTYGKFNIYMYIYYIY